MLSLCGGLTASRDRSAICFERWKSFHADDLHRAGIRPGSLASPLELGALEISYAFRPNDLRLQTVTFLRLSY